MNIFIGMHSGIIKKSTIFVAIILAFTTLSGCTVNKVSLLVRQPTAAPIQASNVKIFPSFNDIREPWRVEGMISAYTLPIISNSSEKRVELIKDTAAGFGINAVIGMQYEVKIGSWNERTGPGRSNGILATIGTSRQQTVETVPKIIVCLPAVNFKIEKSDATGSLDRYLREHIQYTQGYQKGYYVYLCNMPGVDNSVILQGRFDLEALGGPIGLAPDFALLCDVVGYDEQGSIVVNRSKTLRLTFTLYDLLEKKTVWTSTTEAV